MAAHFERMRGVGMAVEIHFARLLMESTFCSSPIQYGEDPLREISTSYDFAQGG